MTHLPAPGACARDGGPACFSPAGNAGALAPAVQVPGDASHPGAHPVELRLLGPLTVRRDGAVLALPASRKVRALLAYLALAPQAATRSQLCDLLWDVPNDPRGELRWCLSKIRSLVDAPGRPRVDARADLVRLQLSDCFVDAAEVARAAQEGFDTLPPERLRSLAALFAGDFLEGLEVDRSPAFDGWLVAQRRRFRAWHAALLEHLVGSDQDAAGKGDALEHLEKWLELTPFDLRVHERLLGSLARRGRIREAEEHVAATLRLFEAEDLETGPVRAAWRSARGRAGSVPGSLPSVPAEFRTSAPPAAQHADGIPDDDRHDRGSVVPRRASIAVMPFADATGAEEARGGAADALAFDVITRLAKLRSLFVIAQGTVFALRERRIGAMEAGRLLKVDYVVSGSARLQDGRLGASVELAETRTGSIIWAERFDHRSDDAFLVLDGIGDSIVASIAGEIEATERNRAILRPPSSLDAWGAHHRGLWHAYRFNKADNDRARHFFEMAVRLDPTFARAHAGLSFTHWQNAFQGWAKRGPETDRAFEAAGQSIMADDRDPAAHWAMGRALWLRGRQDQSVAELEQAVGLSPNFAAGHYALAFVHAQAGDAAAAVESSDHSRRLSPFDPLLFAMLAAQSLALVRLGRFDEAAEAGVKAAARPNAHEHVQAVAVLTLALAGRTKEARAQAAGLRTTRPDYRIGDFLTAFRFAPEDELLFRRAADLIGGPLAAG